MSKEEEEIWAETSDDEKYNPAQYKKGTWEPKPEDILRIFEEIKTKKVLELHWKCPGRRSPDSDKKKAEVVKEEPKEEEKEEEKKPEVTQFDFDDDGPEPKTVMTPRRTPGSAPKSEKKVARMDKVLKDMMYQRKLQAAEKEARKLALARSPRAPGSPSRARLGSPAGSPRTPPVYGARTQSPVRAPGPTEGLATTPLRAPVTADSVVRTSISETISAVASRTETVAREIIKDAIPNVPAAVTVTSPVRTLSGTITPPIRNILLGEVNQESSKFDEPHANSVTPVVTSSVTPMTSSVTSAMTSSITPSAMTSSVTSMTSLTTSESSVTTVVLASGNSLPVPENLTQTSGVTTPANQNENKPETPTAMDTS